MFRPQRIAVKDQANTGAHQHRGAKTDTPILLTLGDLNDPIDVQRVTLADVRASLADALGGPPVMIQGLFVLAISGLETMLLDIYLNFIRTVPAACDFSEARFSRSAILDAVSLLDLMEEHLEVQTNKLAYARFTEVLRKVTDTLHIAEPSFESEMLDRLVEAKETRNLILHNNLRVNQSYLAKAGARRGQISEVRFCLSTLCASHAE